jgi:hypothetical protein
MQTPVRVVPYPAGSVPAAGAQGWVHLSNHVRAIFVALMYVG